jgi:Co/Zn/Cd efflux system component
VRSYEVGVRWPSAWELVSWSSELVVRQSPVSKDVNKEAEEATALEAVTRRQPMKIQQIKKSYFVL